MGLGCGLRVGISNQVLFCGIAKGGVFFGGGKEIVYFHCFVKLRIRVFLIVLEVGYVNFIRFFFNGRKKEDRFIFFHAYSLMKYTQRRVYKMYRTI